MKVRIIVDSTTDVTQEVKERLTVIPLTVHFSDGEYLDGVEISNETFYDKLIECTQLPTTSQPTPDKFEEAYRKAVSEGFEVVVITVSQKLSGTYQSAIIAAEEYKNKVYVVDSKNVTIATGILAELALQYAESGMNARSIAEKIMKKREEVCIVAMLDTLEYLKKGGRISKTVAFAGSVLSIKPVVTLTDGEIKILGKARGSKHGNNLLVAEIEKSNGIDFSMPLLLGYTGNDDNLLKTYIEDSAFLWENNVRNLRYTSIGSVIGTHAGPGAIAVAFFRNI